MEENTLFLISTIESYFIWKSFLKQESSNKVFLVDYYGVGTSRITTKNKCIHKNDHRDNGGHFIPHVLFNLVTKFIASPCINLPITRVSVIFQSAKSWSHPQSLDPKAL